MLLDADHDHAVVVLLLVVVIVIVRLGQRGDPCKTDRDCAFGLVCYTKGTCGDLVAGEKQKTTQRYCL